MLRLLRTPVSSKQLSGSFVKRTFIKNVKPHYRSYTNAPPPPPPNVKGGKGKILLAVGALAIGSTFLAANFNKESPKSAIDTPISSPAFSKGKISVIFVLGGPGSGKGTQCAKLVNDHGFIHLSAGDLLRAEQHRRGSKHGELIDKCIREGTIVPQEVTLALLEQAIKENYSKGSTKFLIDGFPRKMDQALSFEEDIAESTVTLFFECPELVMLERLLERGKTSGRTDDNIESIKKRFSTFLQTSMPVVDHFEKQGKVVKLNCNQPVDEVYKQVKDALKARSV